MTEKEFLEQILVPAKTIAARATCVGTSQEGSCTGECCSDEECSDETCSMDCPDGACNVKVPADVIYEEALSQFKACLNECDSIIKTKYFDVLPTLTIAKQRDNNVVRSCIKEIVLRKDEKGMTVQDLLGIYNKF